MTALLRRAARRPLPAALAALLCALGPLPALAQAWADADAPAWQEDAVPPPPAFSTRNLIDIEMPRTSSVRLGLDPATLVVNRATGVIRYVVVARGPSAVNASYEGIRCATGEFRVYARQVQGGEWVPLTDSAWRPMRGQSGVVVSYPMRLAIDGLCNGAAPRETTREMARELRTANQSLYR